MRPLTPLLFMEAVNGYQKTEVALAAIGFDVFTRIARGSTTASALAAECACAEKGMRILLDALTVLRLLEKENGEYRLTHESAHFLDRRSEAYIGDSIGFSCSPYIRACFGGFSDAVRRGGNPFGTEGTMEPEHSSWVDYARSMTALAEPQAVGVAAVAGPVRRILDIAAGHGLFGIRLLQANPSASCVAVDWANVLPHAAANAAAAGVADRWSACEGSVFDADMGNGYDAAVLANILHHFSNEDCVRILRRVSESLAPRGRVFVVEMLPDEQRTAPSAPAWFATMMLVSTAEGDAYTEAEYAGQLAAAGFDAPERHPLPGSARQVLISTRLD